MKRTLIIIFVVFALMQIIQTEQINPKIDKKYEISTSSNIKNLLKKSCYDCHSSDTKWPFYSKIAPFSWVISNHVENGRKALDFSSWEQYTQEEKNKKLKAIYRTVYGSMPLASYLAFHDEAKLSKEQREEIRKWTGVRKF